MITMCVLIAEEACDRFGLPFQFFFSFSFSFFPVSSTSLALRLLLCVRRDGHPYISHLPIFSLLSPNFFCPPFLTLLALLLRASHSISRTNPLVRTKVPTSVGYANTCRLLTLTSVVTSSIRSAANCLPPPSPPVRPWLAACKLTAIRRRLAETQRLHRDRAR